MKDMIEHYWRDHRKAVIAVAVVLVIAVII
jgi:maltodextrin utilization protein YvdJ